MLEMNNQYCKSATRLQLWSCIKDYQQPAGEVVLFIVPIVYMFNITSLKLPYGYPKHLKNLFAFSQIV